VVFRTSTVKLQRKTVEFGASDEELRSSTE
jgi:hypothetical protein